MHGGTPSNCYICQNFRMLSTQKIHMVDLVSQYERLQEEIDQRILEVVRSAWFIKGPEVENFENELAGYLGIKHVIGCANGTDAIQIALMALDLKPGDEVITPNFTYVSTCEVVALLGLTPVFVENDPDSFNIDPARIEEKITDKTKAIIPVHLFGQCADMEAIMDIADSHNLYVIEDTAQSIGARYRRGRFDGKAAGGIGQIGTTSFFPSKNLGCMGDGGAIFTNDDAIAKRLRMIANHGQERTYYFDDIGVNSRLDAIQAAVLRIKLRHLDEYSEARRTAADIYDELLADVAEVKCPVRVEYSDHVFHQYTMKLCGIDRAGLQAWLKEKGVPSNVYYPMPINKHRAYSHYDNSEYPIAQSLCDCVFSLPMHSELSREQQTYIVEQFKEYIKNEAQ